MPRADRVMAKYQVCAIVQIESDDPRLDPDALEVDTPAKAAALRRAVLKSLPRKVTRVIAVLPVDFAKLMLHAHEQAAEIAGLATVLRPPAGYVPPTRE
jgi:hypothetical protein